MARRLPDDVYDEYKTVLVKCGGNPLRADIFCEKSGLARRLHKMARGLHKKRRPASPAEEDPSRSVPCECGDIMVIQEDQGSMLCKSCARVKTVFGAVHSDEQMFSQETRYTKSDSYQSKKHGERWMDYIFALESSVVPEHIIESIKSYLINSKNIRNVQAIDNMVLRSALSALRLSSKYNAQISQIRQRITKRSIEKPTKEEFQRARHYLHRFLIMFRSKPRKRQNCPYCPYFIYKIFEQILPEDSEKDRQRKCKILSNIYIQSDSTIESCDGLWEEFCNEVDEFRFRATIREQWSRS